MGKEACSHGSLTDSFLGLQGSKSGLILAPFCLSLFLIVLSAAVLYFRGWLN